MCWYCCLVLGRSDKVVKSVRVVVVVFRFWGRLDKNVWVCCSDGGSRSFMTGALGPSLPPLPPFHSPILSLLLLLSPLPLISTPSDPFCPPPPPTNPLFHTKPRHSPMPSSSCPRPWLRTRDSTCRWVRASWLSCLRARFRLRVWF